MKKILLVSLLFVLSAALQAQTYHPTAENLAARKAFQDRKFGIRQIKVRLKGSSSFIIRLY